MKFNNILIIGLMTTASSVAHASNMHSSDLFSLEPHELIEDTKASVVSNLGFADDITTKIQRPTRHIVSESISAGAWNPVGSLFHCTPFSPDPASVRFGEVFVKSQECLRVMERSVAIYKHWSDGENELKTMTKESAVVAVDNSMVATGTKFVVTPAWKFKAVDHFSGDHCPAKDTEGERCTALNAEKSVYDNDRASCVILTCAS